MWREQYHDNLLTDTRGGRACNSHHRLIPTEMLSTPTAGLSFLVLNHRTREPGPGWCLLRVTGEFFAVLQSLLPRQFISRCWPVTAGRPRCSRSTARRPGGAFSPKSLRSQRATARRTWMRVSTYSNLGRQCAWRQTTRRAAVRRSMPQIVPSQRVADRHSRTAADAAP